MTFLGNFLETTCKGYKRLHAEADANQREVIQWKTKYNMAVFEAACNRDAMKMAEE